jgi:hypothetical protein
MKIRTKYDEQKHRSTTTIYAENQVFIGVAQVHPDDTDFASELTGNYISEIKAMIKYYEYKADYHFNMAKKLANTYKHTKELKEVCGQIRSKGFEYVKLAKIYDNELADYVEKKDEYYKRLRDLRNGMLERTEFEYLPDYEESLEKSDGKPNGRSMSDEELWGALGLDKISK